eukprot:g6332.t1
MKNLLVLFSFLLLPIVSSVPTGSLHSCSVSETRGKRLPLEVTRVDVTPDPPEQGKEVHFRLHGVALEEIHLDPGYIRATVFFNEVPLTVQFVSICSALNHPADAEFRSEVDVLTSIVVSSEKVEEELKVEEKRLEMEERKKEEVVEQRKKQEEAKKIEKEKRLEMEKRKKAGGLEGRKKQEGEKTTAAPKAKKQEKTTAAPKAKKQEKTTAAPKTNETHQKISSAALLAKLEAEYQRKRSCVLEKNVPFVLSASAVIPETTFRGLYHVRVEGYRSEQFSSLAFDKDATTSLLKKIESVASVELLGKSPELILCADQTQIVTYGTHAVAIRDYTSSLISFAVAGASSYYLGRLFPFCTKGLLPLITGYLAMGVILGPFVTNMVKAYDIYLLSDVINQFALSFIASAAGSEIFFPDMRGLWRPIMMQLFFIMFFTYCIFVPCMVKASPWIPFMADEPFACKVAISLIAGTIMLARSPASAVAIVQELMAEGPSAKIMLGITVMSDVIVLVGFAITTSIARVLCADERNVHGEKIHHHLIDGKSFDKSSHYHLPKFDYFAVCWIFGELLLSVLVGLLMGFVVRLTLRWPIRRYAISNEYFSIRIYRSQVKAVFILPTLLCAFDLSDRFAQFTSRHFHGRPIKLEPLMICIVAACLAGNDRKNRQKFANILEKSAPAIFLPFFVLTGASLQLDEVWRILSVSIGCTGLRLITVIIGSTLSGVFQQFLKMKTSNAEKKYLWMTLLAQAGVALGLALEVQKAFDEWGQGFATLCISTVVLNQIIGPILCKIGLQYMIEAEDKLGIGTPITFQTSERDEDQVLLFKSLNLDVDSDEGNQSSTSSAKTGSILGGNEMQGLNSELRHFSQRDPEHRRADDYDDDGGGGSSGSSDDSSGFSRPRMRRQSSLRDVHNYGTLPSHKRRKESLIDSSLHSDESSNDEDSSTFAEKELLRGSMIRSALDFRGGRKSPESKSGSRNKKFVSRGKNVGKKKKKRRAKEESTGRSSGVQSRHSQIFPENNPNDEEYRDLFPKSDEDIGRV